MSIDYLGLKKAYLSSDSCMYKREELEYFGGKSNLENAIEDAVIAKIDGKKIPHQYRVRKESISKTSKKIDKIIPEIKKANKFEDILITIQTYKNKGYGRLACIDFAFRVSVITGIQPGVVYVQSGSYEGAKLLGLRLYKDDYEGHYIEKCDIPAELQELDNIALENFLCWYAHETKKKKCINTKRN